MSDKQHINKAVEFLLWHWQHRKPVGPCHFGMGSLFNKIEFPFFRYNLFYYVYVLSFYKKAVTDKRFLEAYKLVESKLEDGKVIVENPNRKLKGMEFCRKDSASELATKRFHEIRKNVGVGKL
jgi:hypothetical protein